jgi:hypothetical protein
MWLASAAGTQQCSRGAIRVRVLLRTALMIGRGRREGRVSTDTHGPRATKKHAAVTTGSAATRPSLRNGFTAYTYSPRGPGFLAPVTRERSLKPLARLAPASGCQDHTTSPSAAAPFVRMTRSCTSLSRPSHPAPRFVTIAHTPLLPRRDGADHASDFGKSQIDFRKTELASVAACWHDGQFAHGRSVIRSCGVTANSIVIPAKAGSSIPETAVLDWRSRGVLDAPLEAA